MRANIHEAYRAVKIYRELAVTIEGVSYMWRNAFSYCALRASLLTAPFPKLELVEEVCRTKA